jgi:hypothetical protein
MMKITRRELRTLMEQAISTKAKGVAQKGPAFEGREALRKAGNEFGKLDDEFYSTLADFILEHLLELDPESANDYDALVHISKQLD